MIPDGVEIRAGRPADEDRALALIHNPPGPEATGIVGREDWAIALGDALQAAGMYLHPGDDFLVATHDGEPIGVALANRGGARSPRWAGMPGLIRQTLRIFPARELPGAVRRGRLRMQVDLPKPTGSLYVSELHVQPAYQRRGIGAALLAAVEDIARTRDIPRLSLTTLATNPARRLYERIGYRVTRESNVAGYEQLTGAKGRVLMEKWRDRP